MRIFLLLLSLPLLCHAQEEPCDDTVNPLQEVVEAVAIPNCFNLMKYNLAIKGKVSPLCGDCRDKFYKNSSIAPSKPSNDLKKDQFFNAAFQEYKKSLTNNLVEIAKLRSLQTTGSKFGSSIEKCSFKSSSSFSNCSSDIKNKLTHDLQKLQDSLASELAQILSSQKLSDRTTGILDRDRSKNLCFISERDILYYTNITLEDSFTPELFDAALSLEGQNFDNIQQLFDALREKNIKNVDQIADRISSHPLLSTYTKKPQDFIKLIKTLDPKNSDGLKRSIYSPKHGDSVDSQIAASCEKSFKAFEKAICSDDYNKGNFSFNPFQKMDYFEDKFVSSEDELASSPEVYDTNLKAFKYCDSTSTSGNFNGTDTLDLISNDLESEFKNLPLKKFSGIKYDRDISSLNESLCEIQKDEKKCIQGTFICNLSKKLKNPSEHESKLAQSSNEEINKLLRTFIGNPKEISPEVRVTLVNAGILPKSDGTLVAQAEIPERQPGYFNKAPAASSAPTTVVSQSQNSKISRTNNNGQSAARYDSPTTFQPTASSSSTPDFSDLLDQSDSNLRDVQNEIMRRLAALPDKKPVSQNQAQQIAHDSLKSRGMTNPSLQNALASRMMAPASAPIPAASSDPFFENNHKESASSSTKTAAEKYKNDGMNRALAEMHGARSASGTSGVNGRTPASSDSAESNDKAISTVALSVPEDPKISLGKVFSDKINKNDPETQMLKVLVNSKKNFILQVNAVNFRVVFDENKKMNLLLDSGDRTEAQRIRPQLEIFFKRLGTI